jgi:hypothetical protein
MRNRKVAQLSVVVVGWASDVGTSAVDASLPQVIVTAHQGHLLDNHIAGYKAIYFVAQTPMGWGGTLVHVGGGDVERS